GDHTRIRRQTYNLVLSILEGTGAEDLREIIDRSALIAHFCAEYRELRGRVMLLRFLEQKGTLAGQSDFLRRLHQQGPQDFYRQALVPLFFDVLDVPG